MKKRETNRIKEHLKDFPLQILPTYLQSFGEKERRLSKLEAIKREFRGNLSPNEERSLDRVNRRMDKMLNPKRFARNVNFIKKIFQSNKIPDRFNPNQIASLGQTSESATKEIKKLFNRNRNVVNDIDRDLFSRGIKGGLDSEAISKVMTKQKNFVAQGKLESSEGSLNQKITYEQSLESERYRAVQNEITLKKPVKIDNGIIDNINTGELDRRMSQIDWSKNYFQKNAIVSSDSAENRQMIDEVGGLMSDLLKIRSSKDEEGKRIHDQLLYKHLSDTPNAAAIGSMREMKEKYEAKAKMDLGLASSENFSPEQLTNLMAGRSVEGQKNANGDKQWYQLDGKKDAQGFQTIKSVPNSQDVSIEAAMLKSEVNGMRDPENSGKDPMAMLKNGEMVQMNIKENGIHVTRMVGFDASKNSLVVNTEESRQRGMIDEPFERGHRQIEDYMQGLRKMGNGKLAVKQTETKNREKSESTSVPPGQGKSIDTLNKVGADPARSESAAQIPAYPIGKEAKPSIPVATIKTSAGISETSVQVNSQKPEVKSKEVYPISERVKPLLIKRADRTDLNQEQKSIVSQKRTSSLTAVPPYTQSPRDMAQQAERGTAKMAMTRQMIMEGWEKLQQRGTSYKEEKALARGR